MTDLHLPRLDLARAVTDALGRGRYVLMTSGDGTPQEITIDLKERDDDLFERTDPALCDQRHAYTDDHGPSVPAQTSRIETPHGALEGVLTDGPFGEPLGVSVYEFALQDALWSLGDDMASEKTLDAVQWRHVPDPVAAVAADWVHVYDRVTRERRTLKRPEPDAVLTGLRDVAADLRGKPVEPPFGCAALPLVGPLTSTEGLRAGDVLRVIWADKHGGMMGWANGDIATVIESYGPGKDAGGEAGAILANRQGERGYQFHADRFAFVGRPDADGWMTWAGGENPVPGAVVDVRFRDLEVVPALKSNKWTWSHVSDHPRDIIAFRIVADQSKV